MKQRPLQRGEIETFIDELWIPAQEEMAAVSEYTLADDIRESGLNYRRTRFSDEEFITFLAWDGEQSLGYATAEIQTPPPIYQQEPECHITELFVRKDARRRNVASELLETVEDWAQTHNCHRLGLQVHQNNSTAISLYKKEGYRITQHDMKKQIAHDR